MRLREKVKADSGLWLLHIGHRKLKIKKQEPSAFEIKQIEVKEKSAKRRAHNHSSEMAVLRKIMYNILIKHDIDMDAERMYVILKREGHVEMLNKKRIVPFLVSLKNDIKNDVTDEKLIELYKTYSTGEIGKMTNTCRAHILDRLYQNGVKIRTSSETKAVIAERKKQ